MKDLKILASQKPIPTRKFSINGIIILNRWFKITYFFILCIDIYCVSYIM